MTGPTAPRVGLRPSGPYVQLFGRDHGGPVSWRMLTGNNRELGRAPGPSESVAACQDAFLAVARRAADLVPASMPVASHRWSWRLSCDGQVLVVSAHSFDRRGRCEMACAQFLREAPRAVLRERVLLTQARSRPHPLRSRSADLVRSPAEELS